MKNLRISKNDKICHVFFNPSEVLHELKHGDVHDLQILQNLLNNSSMKLDKTWESVLIEMLTIITNNNLQRDQRSLLASHAFFKIYTKIFAHTEVNHFIHDFLKLQTNEISTNLSDKIQTLNISDLESCKLTIIHGYLLVLEADIYSLKNFILCFDIIQKNCIHYTKYVYFAFKLLEIWLKKSIRLEFWKNNENSDVEKKLEAVIFSNWDNCINDVAKINSSHVFPIYLNIMNDKYSHFLKYAFETCCQNLSWRCTTKFIILSEITKVWNGLPKFNSWDIHILIQSLSRNHLKHASTKLYLALLYKMNAEEWSHIFMDVLCTTCGEWEESNNINALQLLWDLWMRSTLSKFRCSAEVIPHLWQQFYKHKMIICQSYLARISAELGISWSRLNSFLNKELNDKNIQCWELNAKSNIFMLLIDTRECVRLNTFAFLCHCDDVVNWKPADEILEFIKQFFYFNANANSTQLRKGIFDNYRVFLDRMFKYPMWTTHIRNFFLWLEEYFMYCCEPGSCYQRKIVGLKIFEIFMENCDNPLTDEKLLDRNILTSINRHNLFIFLNLCVDPIEEIREVSFRIICKYWNITTLSSQEITAITSKAIEMLNSSKFYEIAAGVKLLLLISKVPGSENPFYYEDTQNLYEKLWENARKSLDMIKLDLLKTLAKGSNFNGYLMVILELDFNNKLSKHHVSQKFFKKLLDLLEEATTFFLSALSPKSSDVAYSSSFAEMAVAIDEIIRNSEIDNEINNATVTPAHQIILSNIWMALKIICDLSSKISKLPLEFDEIKRSVDLIVTVLMKCRHKGAIEAAGSALGDSMRSLTQKTELNELFDMYLDKLLSLDSRDKINLTRRGAGLSIMFSKMMVNDTKRRLLHIALQRILNSLRNSDDPTIELNIAQNDSTQDSPRARLLHYLRTIVADKSLHPHLVPYMEEIAIISLDHLQSPEWAIRNGSLQLLGAVIPRLVGQSAENELDFGNGYLINHFVTHYPNLSKLILAKLKENSDFKTTNILVPLLTLLSKMAIGGCDFTDYSAENYVHELKTYIHLLLEHSVDHVRFLAAKAYAALIPLNALTDEWQILHQECLDNKSNNYIHGHLLTQINIQQLIKYSGKLIVEDMNLLDSCLESKISKLSVKFVGNFKVQKIRYSKDVFILSSSYDHYEKNIEKLNIHSGAEQQQSINEIMRVVNDSDEEQRSWAINSITMLNILELDHEQKLCVCEALVTLLMDENSDIRTKLCGKLDNLNFVNIIENFVNGNTVMTGSTMITNQDESIKQVIKKNSEFYLHKLVDIIVAFHSLCLSSLCGVRCIEKFVNNILRNNDNDSSLSKNNLESPFDQDETYREDTKLVNIYYACFMNNFRRPLEETLKLTEFTNFTSVITVGNEFYKNYLLLKATESDDSALYTAFEIKVNEYLRHKKKYVRNLINEKINSN